MKVRSLKRLFPYRCQDQYISYYSHGGQAKHTEAAGMKNVKIHVLESYFGRLNKTARNVLGLQRGILICSLKRLEHHGFTNVLSLTEN